MSRFFGLNQISWISLATIGACLIALQGCQKKKAPTEASVGAPAPATAEARPSRPLQPQAPAPSQAGTHAPGPAAPAATCFHQEFSHAEIASHADGEACSQHRNRVAIRHPGVTASSLCVRVDGTPVKFKAVKDKKNADGVTVVFGPVAGPRSKIVASYCIGKARCSNPCAIPKDEFLDAIGGEDEELADSRVRKAKKQKAARWDDSEPADAGDVTAELEGALRRELADDGANSVFEAWIANEEGVECAAKRTPSSS